MCGFSFIISKKDISISEVKKMNKLISHRGPDKEKFYTSKKFLIKIKLLISVQVLDALEL